MAIFNIKIKLDYKLKAKNQDYAHSRASEIDDYIQKHMKKYSVTLINKEIQIEKDE